ncbi:MAG: cob(I)yrinic acid a,c-diamide adenosyltransferase [Ardenticatenaceae bacterium]|nr:cob(I)yrinic acid a,c-diamide adenosyltransferase [Ardenticatenaceae bacterium]HBY96254.1 cob(I)yrinic acid a,c-diamide adenosyltransferase [Chloroflexota bacterium]
MRIYTRTGDEGMTGLFGGRRVGKDSVRIEACGAVDECNTTLGIVRTLLDDPELAERLAWIQSDLFVVGADVATLEMPGKTAATRVPRVQPEDVTRLERWIDEAEVELEPLRTFILPGGTAAAAHLHFARTVCRRAERRVVALGGLEAINPQVVRYLNRLSDFLFVSARLANRRAGIVETLQPSRQTGGEATSSVVAA